MTFDVVLLAFACLLVIGALIARKLWDLFVKLRTRFVDWIERKQFERLVDRVGESER